MKSRNIQIIDAYPKFHRYHGSNVILYDNNRVAYRKASYANSLAFSEKPLKLGELFLLEIEMTEHGWTGDMRIGLTQLNPYDAESRNMVLPQYALPDLSKMKSSWICGISKSRIVNRHLNSSLKTERNCLKTCHGSVPFSSLQPSSSSSSTTSDILPTDVGSKIGIVYFPVPESDKFDGQELAEMHFIVNGEDQGAYAKDIPYTEQPLYVVIDVYGCTKQVRIVQLAYGVPSLQSTCREAILRHIKHSAVSKLPLPRVLKEYLCSSVDSNTGQNQ